MKNNLMRAMVLTGFLAGTLTSTLAQKTDPAYDLYRKAVLGETNVIVVDSRARCEAGRWAPGPYALYLMRNGASQEDALRQAQGIGERAEWVPCATPRARPVLTGFELYQRAVMGVPESEILRARGVPPSTQTNEP